MSFSRKTKQNVGIIKIINYFLCLALEEVINCQFPVIIRISHDTKKRNTPRSALWEQHTQINLIAPYKERKQIQCNTFLVHSPCARVKTSANKSSRRDQLIRKTRLNLIRAYKEGGRTFWHIYRTGCDHMTPDLPSAPWWSRCKHPVPQSCSDELVFIS